ncbi:MAG: T9SS type A sorting domain-containing protein [Bacteroidetes bacterium]|nr:T9SS type A sorting domain-containing protein [Bacteroidota bacterium]
MNNFKLSILCISFCFLVMWATTYQPAQTFNPTTDSYQEGPQEFFKFHQEIRTPADATEPQYEKGFLIRERQKSVAAARSNRLNNARTQSNGVVEWKERGPANVPGRTRGLLVDPADPNKNTWYAGSASGGVWKTTNAGANWTLITPDLTNLATTVLAMAASNPNTIYLGTGEGFGNLDGVQGNGMYKSADRGVTWSYLPSTANFDDINRAIVSPTNENVVVVAAQTGIYKTTDGGQNWTRVSSRPIIQDLKATPGNFNIQYATQNGTGVLKSVDAGDTWSLSNAGMSPVLRCEIDVCPSRPNRIYASCENGDSPKMMMSDDAGVTWSLIDVKLTTAPLNFLNGQGWYDNTIACDPFNPNVIYFGGVDLFQTTLDGTTSTGGFYTIEDVGYSSFATLTNFTNATNGNFDVGSSANGVTVEIRFGPGRSQKAHRFLVPSGATSGVPNTSYAYQDYVNVPFEIWDITNNRQLMASFRDQGRDGAFNLINFNTDNTEATLQSREYLYVNNVDYNGTTPNPSIAVNGGHIFNQMYFIWPTLNSNATWPPTSNSLLRFKFSNQLRLNGTTTFITDGRGQYGSPSKNSIVHVDHHNLVMIPMSANTYKILNANDGGIFVSNTSFTPGINDGNWTFAGSNYNTSQFYGADKRPGFDEYFGGMQDNGTWKSRPGEVASPTSQYNFNIGGDGFEVIWNNLDDKKLIGGSQNNNFRRSADGGSTWAVATSGLSGTHPFISKLANSRDNPEVIYTLSSAGVFTSTNFGQTWTLTPITEKWGGTTSLMDIEVSRANANIVWAGSGMVNSGTLRNLQVSTNGGKTFAATNNYTAVTMGGITRLASHPTQANTAYALFSFSGRPKILRTTDLGQTWFDISGYGTNSTSSNGFPNVATYCLYVRPDDPNIIWAGTEIGIVESLDAGATWNILDDFPNVSVWDMKGLDDQVVIATHGRGIWTARIEKAQASPIERPEALAIGTNPQSDLAVKFRLRQPFDSVVFFINTVKAGKIMTIPNGDYIARIKNAQKGAVTVNLIGYKNSAPFASSNFGGQNVILANGFPQKYANLFTDLTAFSIQGFVLADFGTSNQSLQTPHPYFANTEPTAMLLQPIVVSPTSSNFFYQDVALVQTSPTGVQFGQPGFKDFVVVEATKNGLDWIPLKDGYNASANPAWLTALNANQAGTPTLQVDQNIDLKTKFSANDTLLFRFRLKSDNDNVTGWGWSIDNLFIQQQPTGIEPASTIEAFSIFPNPTDGKATIRYNLRQQSAVMIEVMDATGKIAIQESIGAQDVGTHEHQINLDGKSEGVFVVRVKAGNEIKTSKMVLKK